LGCGSARRQEEENRGDAETRRRKNRRKPAGNLIACPTLARIDRDFKKLMDEVEGAAPAAALVA